MLQRRLVRLTLILSGFLVYASVLPAAAQGTQPGRQAPMQRQSKPAWETRVRVGADEGRYDDNVFKLSDEQKSTLQNAGAAEALSGRFNDMEAKYDFVITPTLEIETVGPGMGGRKMALEAKVGFNVYTRNTARRHVEVDLSLAQSTSRNGRARVRFGFVPNYFQKNYLFDAVDGDGDGSISDAERVYRRGEYNTWDVSGDYRHRVLRGENTDVFIWGGVGFLTRTYGASFPARNRDVPYGDVGLRVERKRWEIDLSGGLAAVNTPRLNEVLLLDEPDFGIDFNGDGDTSDLNVRSVQLVDRTRTALRFEVDAEFELAKSTDLNLTYRRRQRKFLSTEMFDVAHLGRTDYRDVVNVALSFRLVAGLNMGIGYYYAAQDTNRIGDPGSVGETTDYRRNRASVVFRYGF